MDTQNKNLGETEYRGYSERGKIWRSWNTQTLTEDEQEIDYITPARLNPVKYVYSEFFENIQITKETDRKTRQTNKKAYGLLSLAFRALKTLKTDKARTLRKKIANKLKRIHQDKTTFKPFIPTERDHGIVEGWNNYYEFIAALKLHYDKPLSFQNTESPEEINTLRKQKNQFCYSYDGLSKTRMITKPDKLFDLSDMRAGWKYSITFRCPICGDERHAQYKPRAKKTNYKIPAHECTTTARASNYRRLITTRSLRVLKFLNLFDKDANTDRSPNTWKNRYGTHSGEKARLIETESYRLGEFPTKQVKHGNMEYAITKVTRNKREITQRRLLGI